MDPLSLIIQIIGGAAGGNIAGSLLKNMSLGTAGNSIAGLIGGLLGGNVLNSALGLGKVASTGLDIGALITQVAGSGVGGGVVMILVGLLRSIFQK